MKKLKLREINDLIIRQSKPSKPSFIEMFEKGQPDFSKYLETIDEKFNVAEKAIFMTGIALAWYSVDKLIAKVPLFNEEAFEKHAQAFEDEMEAALKVAGDDPDESSDTIERISSQPNLIFSMFNLLQGMWDAVKKKDVREKKIKIITYYYIVFAEAIVRYAVFNNNTEIVSIRNGKTIRESICDETGRSLEVTAYGTRARESQELYVVGNNNSSAAVDSMMIYKLTVTLNDIKPKIWRSIHVPGNITLHDLHRIIQTTMGWTNSHLYKFSDNEKSYSLPDPDKKGNSGKSKNAKRSFISEIVSEKGSQFTYTYDFGDGWEHSIVCNDILQPDGNERYPVCVGGARACPPENCGGTWGYARILEAIRNPMHPEHESIRHRIGGGFMPEEFDLKEVNLRLQEKNYGCVSW